MLKWSNTLWPDGRIRLFALYTAPFSALCRRIWRYWTSKILASYLLPCLRLGQFYQLSFMQYMGLCVFSISISPKIILRICVLYLIIIIKSEVWPICNCLALGHETMTCAICLFIFLGRYVLFCFHLSHDSLVLCTNKGVVSTSKNIDQLNKFNYIRACKNENLYLDVRHHQLVQLFDRISRLSVGHNLFPEAL